MNKICIALAAGGTGGHLFPAEAVARELLQRDYHVILLTDKRGEALSQQIKQRLSAIDIHIIRAASPTKKNPKDIAAAIHELWHGFRQSKKILKQKQVRAVIGFGGYASVPALRAAKSLKLPFFIHEQNMVLGLANRLVYKSTTKTFLSYANTQRAPLASKNYVTGYLVRDEFLQKQDHIYAAPEGAIKILAIGGSAGAKVFSDLIPGACALLPEEIRKNIDINQQCRAEYLAETAARYKTAGVRAELSPFFTNVVDLMAGSHLVIARSGGTVTELMTLGLPSILIPLPTSADDHQTANAKLLADAGAAILTPQSALTPEKLAKLLNDLLTNPVELTQMAHSAKSLSMSDAAVKVADAVQLYLEPVHDRPNQNTFRQSAGSQAL